MRHIFSKMLQIMVSLEKHDLVEENKKTGYCYYAMFFNKRSNFNNFTQKLQAVIQILTIKWPTKK